MKDVILGVVLFIVLIIIVFYLKRERYEEPAPAPAPAPAPPQAVDNPALESLKEKFKACGQDEACVQRVALEAIRAQQVTKKNNM